jgi:hypothetical protein
MDKRVNRVILSKLMLFINSKTSMNQFIANDKV